MDLQRKTAIRNNRNFSKKYYYTGSYQTRTTIRLTRYNNRVLESEMVDPGIESFHSLIREDCINWFEVRGLNDSDNIIRLLTEFGMHSLDARDILTPAHVVKIDRNDSYLFVVMNSCTISQDHRIHSDHVGMVVTEKVVMSFNEGNVPLFENVDRGLNEDIMNLRGQKSGMLFAFLLNSIMVDLMESAAKVERMLEQVEDQLLGRNYNQKNLGKKIQECRHVYLIIRKNSVPLKQQFYVLMEPMDGIIPLPVLPVFKDIRDQLEYIIETMKNSNDILTSLVDLYVSNNDFKTNVIMKRLTIVSTIFAPITFLVGVWGMNFAYMPELNTKYGYLIAWIILLATAIFTWFYMKGKKWF